MDMGFAIDLLVIALLAAVGGYCVILDRKLGAIRAGQADLSHFLDKLTVATAMAERAMAGLRSSADATTTRLQENTKQARALADELSILVESGSRLAARIDAGASAEPANPKATLLRALKEVR